ncbi:hypothetical protein PG984_010130 [Apiospora sp. TS-2023a]
MPFQPHRARSTVNQLNRAQARPSPLRDEDGQVTIDNAVLDIQLPQMRHVAPLGPRELERRRQLLVIGPEHAAGREGEPAELPRQVAIEGEVQVSLKKVVILPQETVLVVTPEPQIEGLEACQERGPRRLVPRGDIHGDQVLDREAADPRILRQGLPHGSEVGPPGLVVFELLRRLGGPVARPPQLFPSVSESVSFLVAAVVRRRE